MFNFALHFVIYCLAAVFAVVLIKPFLQLVATLFAMAGPVALILSPFLAIALLVWATVTNRFAMGLGLIGVLVACIGIGVAIANFLFPVNPTRKDIQPDANQSATLHS